MEAVNSNLPYLVNLRQALHACTKPLENNEEAHPYLHFDSTTEHFSATEDKTDSIKSLYTHFVGGAAWREALKDEVRQIKRSRSIVNTPHGYVGIQEIAISLSQSCMDHIETLENRQITLSEELERSSLWVYLLNKIGDIFSFLCTSPKQHFEQNREALAEMRSFILRRKEYLERALHDAE